MVPLLVPVVPPPVAPPLVPVAPSIVPRGSSPGCRSSSPGRRGSSFCSCRSLLGARGSPPGSHGSSPGCGFCGLWFLPLVPVVPTLVLLVSCLDSRGSYPGSCTLVPKGWVGGSRGCCAKGCAAVPGVQGPGILGSSRGFGGSFCVVRSVRYVLVVCSSLGAVLVLRFDLAACWSVLRPALCHLRLLFLICFSVFCVLVDVPCVL